MIFQNVSQEPTTKSLFNFFFFPPPNRFNFKLLQDVYHKIKTFVNQKKLSSTPQSLSKKIPHSFHAVQGYGRW